MFVANMEADGSLYVAFGETEEEAKNAIFEGYNNRAIIKPYEFRAAKLNLEVTYEEVEICVAQYYARNFDGRPVCYDSLEEWYGIDVFEAIVGDCFCNGNRVTLRLGV